MRLSIRPITAILLSAVLLMSTMAFKCGDGTKTPEQEKQEFIAYAQDIVGAFTDARSLVVSLNPGLAGRYDIATQIARDLLAATQNSNETEAARLVVALVPAFTSIAGEFTGNTKILAILALGQIGLRFYANHYMNAVRTGGGQGASAGNSRVRAFARAKNWRCRSSQNGRFQKMEFCRAHPDVSQVETY